MDESIITMESLGNAIFKHIFVPFSKKTLYYVNSNVHCDNCANCWRTSSYYYCRIKFRNFCKNLAWERIVRELKGGLDRMGLGILKNDIFFAILFCQENKSITVCAVLSIWSKNVPFFSRYVHPFYTFFYW